MMYILLLTYFCIVWLTNCIPFPIFDIILEISSTWVPQGFFHLSLPIWTPLHVDAIAHVTGRKHTQIFKCSVQFVCFCVLFVWGFFRGRGGGRYSWNTTLLMYVCFYLVGRRGGGGVRKGRGCVGGIRNTTLLTLNNNQSIYLDNYFLLFFLSGFNVNNNSFYKSPCSRLYNLL